MDIAVTGYSYYHADLWSSVSSPDQATSSVDVYGAYETILLDCDGKCDLS